MVNNTWFSKSPNSLNIATVTSNIQNGTEPSKSWKCFPVRTYEKYSTYKEALLRGKELFSCSEQSDSGIMVNKKRKKTPNVRLSNFLEDCSDSAGSSSAVESPVKIVKAKPKSSTPHPRKSLDFNSRPTNIVAGVCKTIFNDCTDSMFEELVKEWFKHGKQRYFRENKNNNVPPSLNASM